MKRMILMLMAVLTMTLTPALALTGTAAAACGTGSSSKAKVLEGIGQAGSDCKTKGITHAINGVVRILSLIVGMAAIVMIIVAGFKYITSGGDANKVGGAKQTLIYALVGLVLAALAQILVHFILNQTDKAVGIPRQENSKVTLA
jgi:hypothetical protein